MATTSLYPFEWLGKSRASLPKVKTGCITCKKRHVKCDECKPICNRCHKSKRECVYQTQQPDVSTDASLRIQIAYPSPQSPPAWKFFSCQYERSGFESFQQIPAEVLGGGLGWREWGTVVLQTSEGDPALRHAAIALGAIHEHAMRIRNETSATEYQMLPVAFMQYHQAIRTLRAQLDHDFKQSLEAHILVCMLLVIFDFMQGDDRAAEAHLFGGIAMLRSYLAKTHTTDPLIERISAPWRTSVERSGLLPTDGCLGARLLHSYSFLDFWSHCWMDSLPALPEVPIMEGLSVRRPPNNPDTELNTHYQTFSGIENRIREFLRAVRSRKQQPHACEANFAGMKTTLIEILAAWHADHDHLCSVNIAKEYWDFRALNVVAINHRKIEIMLLASQEDGTMNYQTFTPAFREVVVMSREVYEREDFPKMSPHYNNSPFAFSFGIIQPLYITALNCVDLSVQREAINMLSSRHWSE